MANNIKGITIEIGGNTAPLDKALKDVNKSSRDLQSELRQVNNQLKFDPGNTTLLAQKQKLLAESITNTKSKLDSLKEAEKQVQQQFQQGKVGEEQFRALQREVIKTEDQLKRLEKQASTCNTTLGKISETTNKVGSAAGNVAGKMAPATLAVGALGVASFKMGSDLVESTNKVEVAFKDNAKSVEDWSDTTLDKFGIAKGSALDMASLFGDMGTAMGQSTDEAANMSTSLVGLAGDLASFKNIGIDQAQDALKGIFTGEGESLKSLGVIMQDSTLKEFALKEGITKKYEEMTQAEKVQLRYNYVMEMTKNAQGDFARTSDGAANSTRTASESAKEAASSFGVILAPIIANIAQHVTALLKSFGGLGDETKKVILVILALIAAIAPIAGLIAGIATIGGAVVTVIGTITGAIAILTGAEIEATLASKVLAGSIKFITGPVGIVITIITALVAAFMYFWNTSESFRNFWIGLWEGIKTTVSNVVNGIKTFFTEALPQAFNSFKESISQWGSNIKTSFSEIWNSIKEKVSAVIEGIKTFFTSTLPEAFNSFKNTLSQWGTNIKNFFSEIWNTIKTTTSEVVGGIVSFVKDKFDWLINGVKIIFNGLKTFFTGFWNLIKTLFLGPILLILDLVTGNFTKLKQDAINIFNNLKNALLMVWEGIKTVFTGAINIIINFCINVWNGLLIILTTIWNTLKNVAIATWTALKNGVIDIVNGVVQGAINLWNGFLNFLVSFWNTITNTAINAWNGLKNAITNIVNAIIQGVINIWNGLLNWFANLPGALYNYGVNMFNSMGNGISSAIGWIHDIVVNGFNSAIDFITSLPGKAYTWGKDFIEGLVGGIKDMIGTVVDAVSGVAERIRNFLHFSVPDEGPLTDYETWMPDFMEGLSKGIQNSKHLVTNAIKGLATDVNVGMQLNPSSIGIGGNSPETISKNDTTINFNGNYGFNNKQDIDYFMNQAALKLKGLR